MAEDKKDHQTKTSDGNASKKRAPRRARNKARLISRVIAKIEDKLESDDLKPSVGDFIRLLQLEKELDEEQPKEIKVSWVESEEHEEPENVSVK